MKQNTAPFYIGQEVVALKSNWQWCIEHGISYPKKNEICVIDGIFESRGFWFLYLKGYDTAGVYGKRIDFNSLYFAPVSRLRISDKLTIAADLLQPQVEERIDQPVKIEA